MEGDATTLKAIGTKKMVTRAIGSEPLNGLLLQNVTLLLIVMHPSPSINLGVHLKAVRVWSATGLPGR